LPRHQPSFTKHTPGENVAFAFAIHSRVELCADELVVGGGGAAAAAHSSTRETSETQSSNFDATWRC